MLMIGLQGTPLTYPARCPEMRISTLCWRTKGGATTIDTKMTKTSRLDNEENDVNDKNAVP